MMISFKSPNNKSSLFRKYFKFRTSIYSQIIYIITILSVLMFIAFGVIFRSVNEEYMKSVVQQSGNNVGIMVEGALYYSMLENDKKALQNTLNVINTMPDIDDVNMYDSKDNLVYSSFSRGTARHNNPNCKSCHKDIAAMFPKKEKSFRIIDTDDECKMSNNADNGRRLLIRSPILNRPSCYESSCHAHEKSDEVLGSFVIRIPLEELDTALVKSSNDFYLLATVLTVLFIIFFIFFTRFEIKRPLNAIIKASKAVAAGEKSTRLEIKHNQLDDIRMVSEAFNAMLDNLQLATNELQNWSHQLEYKVQKKTEELGKVQNELMQIERIASLGKLASSVAHEINNPLSGILTYAKLVYKQLNNIDGCDSEKKDSMLSHLRLIENETKRCGDIVKGLLDFSKNDQKDFIPNGLHKILRETYDLMAHAIKIANITFLTDFSASQDVIFCSPNQIKQACIAILVNSSEAVLESGEIVIRTSNPDDKTILIEISDNGVGIAQEDLTHIFEPFFSTKQNASGIGLGLAIVHGIVKNNKGKIEVKSIQGKGTSMFLRFPLVIEEADGH